MTTKDPSRLGRGPAPLGSTGLGEIRRRSWVRPLIAAVVLAVVGIWARTHMNRSLREDLQSELHTLLEVAVSSVETWLEMHERAVTITADQPAIVAAVQRQLELSRLNATTDADLAASEAQAELVRELTPLVRSYGYDGFAIVSPRGQKIAKWSTTGETKVGMHIDQAYMPTLRRVLDGETLVTPPILPDDLEAAGFGPSLVAIAPVGVGEEVVAGLAFAMNPARFTERLELAWMGESGETYAFNADGAMVSESRFKKDLVAAGLLGDVRDSTILQIEIRDPGGNLTRGFESTAPMRNRPYTFMAAAALEGAAKNRSVSGIDVDGHLDYRGVPVVGAWHWLEHYRMGIATEIDVAEAFRIRDRVQLAFYALIGISLVGAGILFLLSRRVFALAAEVDAAQQLGQYTLKEPIGEGAIGKVFRAEHALLRRPTAVKLLDPDKADEQSIKRFEREVQLTSRLTHPNTIQIFDYGISPEGTFFYAMEYLPGTDLDRVVEETGPQPEARVVHILQQAAGSLAEAHACGLIHRDVKPANIVLCERGGDYDTVKVLDFGLVKALEPDATEANLTMAGRLLGTPLFVSPEAIRSQREVDGRSDLYSLGAVAYFLVTGTYVFDRAPVGEVLGQHMLAEPEAPSVRLGRPVDKGLEALILRMLAKEPDDRPASAAEVRRMLLGLENIGPWGNDEYLEWARAHRWEAQESAH